MATLTLASNPDLTVFLTYALSVSPLVLVQLGGAIWALLSLGRRGSGGPASLTLIGLACMLLTLLGRGILLLALSGGDTSGAEMARAHQAFGIVAMILESVGLVCLVVAALAWRGAPTQTAQ